MNGLTYRSFANMARVLGHREAERIARDCYYSERERISALCERYEALQDDIDTDLNENANGRWSD